jgi:hypothetical protein
MTTTQKTAQVLNGALLILLIVSVGGFLSFQNIYGFFLASVTALIAYGISKKAAIAYFAAAAWGLACYQLAKQDYEFQLIKHYVMLVGIVVIPIALFLHEVLARKKDVTAQKSITEKINDRNMPQ